VKAEECANKGEPIGVRLTIEAAMRKKMVMKMASALRNASNDDVVVTLEAAMKIHLIVRNVSGDESKGVL